MAADRERLQGTWSVIRVTIGGKEVDGPNMLLAPMTFRGDEVDFGPFGNPPQKNHYRFRIDPEGELGRSGSSRPTGPAASRGGGSTP